jgi:hypothetical protein
VSGGAIGVVRRVQRVWLWCGNVVGGRAGCGAAALWLIFAVGATAVVGAVDGATARCSADEVVVVVRRRGVVTASVGVPGRAGCLVVGFEKLSRPSWPKMCGVEHAFGACEQPWHILHQKSFFGALVLGHLPVEARGGAKWGRWVYERSKQRLGVTAQPQRVPVH